MSMDASGGFGGTLVFGKWKGRQVVRQLVTPSNPRSSGQELARNRVRVVGVAQHWAQYTTLKKGAETLTDKQRLSATAPSGQAWNGFLSKSIIGKTGADYTAARAAYAALSGGQKTAWGTAAAALTPPFGAAVQTSEGGAAATAIDAGECFFIYSYGLMKALGDATPTGTPPTYA